MASRLPLIEIYTDGAGEHRWRMVARNGRIVADSAEGYNTRHKARRALIGVLTALGLDANGTNGDGTPYVTFAELD